MKQITFPHEQNKAKVLKFEKKVKASPLNNFLSVIAKPVKDTSKGA